MITFPGKLVCKYVSCQLCSEVRTSNMAAPRQSSTVWKYFTLVNNLNSDKKKASCNECGTVCSRGNNPMKLTNSSMLYHLNTKHPQLQKEKDSLDEKQADKKRKREEEQCFLEQSKKARMTNIQPTLIVKLERPCRQMGI